MHVTLFYFSSLLHASVKYMYIPGIHICIHVYHTRSCPFLIPVTSKLFQVYFGWDVLLIMHQRLGRYASRDQLVSALGFNGWKWSWHVLLPFAMVLLSSGSFKESLQYLIKRLNSIYWKAGHSSFVTHCNLHIWFHGPNLISYGDNSS